MKIFFLILVLIHGLVHLMGFLKSFGLAEFSQLTQDISKPLGVLWLLLAFLFLAVIILFVFNKEWWWIPAIIATVISQLLIILSWQDAKFGTIPNIIILVSVIIGFAVWNFNMQINKEINRLLLEAESSEDVIVTQEMLNNIPPQVQLWLSNIGMVGNHKIHTVYFKQKGLMKLKPDQKEWSNAVAEQYVTTDNPAFIWKVNMEMLPIVDVIGRDLFRDGKGQMVIKIASLIPVVDIAHNEKVNQSTMQRYLLELPWYPSAALSSYIAWESIDEYTAKATMTYNGVSGAATFHFNKNGDLEKMKALRYKDSDESAELIECIGEVKENTIIDGIKIPTKLNISWMLDGGIYTWYKLEIYDVAFN